MTDAQKRLRELRERQSKERGRMAELALADDLTTEQRSELDTIEKGTSNLEAQIRAATVAVDTEDAEAKAQGKKANTGDNPDAEQRERLELRSKAMLGNFIKAALRGRAVTGAEAELQEAAGCDGIPLELWDVPQPENRAENGNSEARNVTPAPGTVGINLDPIRPAVFAPSIADKLMIEMPMVPSGTFATGTISSTAGSVITADAVAKSAAVPNTAGAITVGTTKAKRVGGQLLLTLEDIASVGTANFEAVLRENLSLIISDELDDQMINGDGMNDDLTGIFERLTNPSAPGATVASFDDFVASFAGGIDGLWSSMMTHVSIVSGVETYRLSARTFRDASGADLGDMAFADYAMKHTAGWWTNRRMPAVASDIQQGVLCRKGRTGMRTAVCPHWGSISVDDIYSGAAKGERSFTISVLVGDVILVQPDAYAQVSYRTTV